LRHQLLLRQFKHNNPLLLRQLLQLRQRQLIRLLNQFQF
jgi:hypothetical protein